MLTANSIAATYSGASWADTFRLLRASTDMVAVLLYNPPTMPDTKIPDSRNTYLFQQIRKVGNARYNHRGQPNTVRRQVDAGIRFSLGSIGRIMPLMARNLASVIISSFFMRWASSVKVCFSSVKSRTVTMTMT